MNKISKFILYLSVFLFIFMLTVSYCAIDMDYWARLLQGQAFFELGHILKTDPFSYTKTHLWLDHEWGSSVIFYFVQNLGYTIVLLFKTLIVLLTFFFIFKTINLRETKTNSLFNIVYFICAVYAMPTITQSWLRCHFFTFLFFAVSLYILEKVRRTQNYKLLFCLPALMLFWGNMHGGCVSLLGILALYSIGEFLNKKSYKYYLYALLACFAVMFINPYGFEYVKFIFMATTMSRPFVTEWISPFSHPDWTFLLEFKIFYIINFIVLLFSLKKLKTDYTKYFILIVCGYLSFRYVKNTPFFIIVSMIFLYDELYTFLSRIFSKIKVNTNNISLFFCLLLIGFSCFYLWKNVFKIFFPDLSQQPYSVVSFIKQYDLKGNVLAPFDMGSYLIYKLYPDNLIYMDGRYEEVYYKETKELHDKFYNTAKDWDRILNLDLRHDFIIVPRDALLNDYLQERTDYKLIYNEDKAFLYARSDLPAIESKISPYEIYLKSFISPFSSNVKFK